MTKMFIIVILLFSTIAPMIWCGVVFIISLSSGWHSLAQTYATDRFPENSKSCSGVFNFASNYSGTLKYSENKEGLFLKTIFLFNIGHKPLFIPWSAIKNHERSGSLFAKNAITFKVDSTKIKLYLDNDFEYNKVK